MLESSFSIRCATPDDNVEISDLIINTVRETNSKDYSVGIIEEVVASFVPDKVKKLIDTRQVFVAVDWNYIIGTASLDGETIRSVFVLPEEQNRGVGKALIRHIENIAGMQGIMVLTVPSSITAESFYKKHGYVALRDEYYGEERTIIMEKHLEKKL